MAGNATGRTGRRVAPAASRRSGYHTNRRGNKRSGEKPLSRRERRWMVQMLVSAALLLAVVGIKLASPDMVARYRERLLDLMGREVDFVETFSAVGRAIGDGALPDALGEAYQQVFGPSQEILDEEEPDTVGEEGQAVYSSENLPTDVCLEQQTLGICYSTPLAGEITSRFGYRNHPVSGDEKFHYGVDVAAEEGDVIKAFASGTVTAVGKSSELGNYVMIDHGDNLASLYAHCRRVTASSGQRVQCGDPIAEVGQTGQATGPHLHFELHRNTTYLNPIYYVAI